MNTTTLQSAQMQEIEFVPFAVEIHVSDFDKSISFYRDILGFDLFRLDDQPKDRFASLRFHDSVLMIKEVRDLPSKRGAGVVLRFIMKNGLEEYYASLSGRGVAVVKPLKEMSYCLVRFYIDDPDGYHLKFAQRVSSV